MRRLPVLQTQHPEDETSRQRPRSQWVAIGAGLTLTIWTPLLLVGLYVGRKLAGWVAGTADLSQLGNGGPTGRRWLVASMLIAPVVLSFSFACLAAGAMVGRFGRDHRDGVMGPLAAAVGAWGLTAMGGSLSPWPVAVATGLILLLIAAAFGALGTRLGVRRRART